MGFHFGVTLAHTERQTDLEVVGEIIANSYFEAFAGPPGLVVRLLS
jgi:hypothetical protein